MCRMYSMDISRICLLKNKKMSKFTITLGKGFRIQFNNGFILSVQWGSGNYCENQNKEWMGKVEFWESSDAEIAVIDEDGAFISLGEDTVKGWVTADEVAEVIGIVQSSSTKEEIKEKMSKSKGYDKPWN